MESKETEPDARPEVQAALAESSFTGSLDLSSQRIYSLQQLFDAANLRNIQSLYLTDNFLTVLPNTFWSQCPSLRYLDLRSNKLTELPSKDLADVIYLQTLLLQNNNLKSLPSELGFLCNLRQINVRGNDLICPPSSVLSRGTSGILEHLRGIANQKQSEEPSSDKSICDTNSTSETFSSEFSLKSSSPRSEKSEPDRSESESGNFTQTDSETTIANRINSGASKRSPFLPPIEKNDRQNVPLHDSFAVNEADGVFFERRAKENGKINGKIMSGIVTEETVRRKERDYRKLAKIRKSKSKIDKDLQQLRDKETREIFRKKTRELQMQLSTAMRTGQIDIPEVAKDAPFDVNLEDIRVLTNVERLSIDPSRKPSKPSNISPRTRVLVEKHGEYIDAELSKRARNHLRNLKDREKPEIPSDGLEAARRDLAVATRLQEQIKKRRAQMEIQMGFMEQALQAIE